jgi:hypothetical protein
MAQPSSLPKKTSDRLRLVARFLGKPAAVTLGLGFLGSSMLALAEFGVALFIQIFLVALGIMTQPPSGFLGSLAISLPLAGLFLAAVAGFRSCGQFLVILSSSKSMALMQQRLRLTLCADLLHNTTPPDRTLTQSLLSEVFQSLACWPKTAPCLCWPGKRQPWPQCFCCWSWF